VGSHHQAPSALCPAPPRPRPRRGERARRHPTPSRVDASTNLVSATGIESALERNRAFAAGGHERQVHEPRRTTAQDEPVALAGEPGVSSLTSQTRGASNESEQPNRELHARAAAAAEGARRGAR